MDQGARQDRNRRYNNTPPRPRRYHAQWADDKVDDNVNQQVYQSYQSQQPQRQDGQEDEVVTVPKSQMSLLYKQINDLAKSVAEKERAARDPGRGQQGPYNNRYGNNNNSYQRNASNGSRYPSSSSSRYQQPQPESTMSQTDIRALMDGLPIYNGALGESFNWWKEQVESFCRTFNVRMNKVEWMLAGVLIKGKALEVYRNMQKELFGNDDNNSATKNEKPTPYWRRPLSWAVVTRELAKLDNPLLRSDHIHTQINNLRYRTLGREGRLDNAAVMDLIGKFRKLETQLDPAPLGDRLWLLLRVIPEARRMVFEKIESEDKREEETEEGTAPQRDQDADSRVVFNNIDEICDFILIHLAELFSSVNSRPTSNFGSGNPRYKTTAPSNPAPQVQQPAQVTAEQETKESVEISEPEETADEATPIVPVINLPPSSSPAPSSAGDQSPSDPSLTNVVCSYCSKQGHLSNKCFKRKKQRQKEKVKMYDLIKGSAGAGTTMPPLTGQDEGEPEPSDKTDQAEQNNQPEKADQAEQQEQPDQHSTETHE